MEQVSVASVVIVEQGAEWLKTDSDAALAQDSSDRVMIVQQPAETPGELALRVTRRVDLLRNSGVAIGLAVIAAGDRADDQIFQARCQIARALLTAMSTPQPRLRFSASRWISDATRHELLAIAGTLTGQLHGTSIEVSVRFGESSAADRTLPLAAGLHRGNGLRALEVA